jgi:hypothetical protein
MRLFQMDKLSGMQHDLNVGARGFELWECTYRSSPPTGIAADARVY